MARHIHEDSQMYDPQLVMGVKAGVGIRTLAGPITLDRDCEFLQMIDPGGVARTVTLPPAERGLLIIINNISSGLFTITVNNPAAVAVGSLAQNTAGVAMSDGINWYVRLIG